MSVLCVIVFGGATDRRRKGCVWSERGVGGEDCDVCCRGMGVVEGGGLERVNGGCAGLL